MSYSNPTVNGSYEAPGAFQNSSAMEKTVFKLTRIFLDGVVPDSFLPQDIIDQIIDDPNSVTDWNDDSVQEMVDIAQANAGYFALIIIGFIIAILLWIIGRPSLAKNGKEYVVCVGGFAKREK